MRLSRQLAIGGRSEGALRCLIEQTVAECLALEAEGWRPVPPGLSITYYPERGELTATWRMERLDLSASSRPG